jgi:hypothetical protein
MLDLVYASYRASVDDLSGDISDWTIEVNTIFLVCRFCSSHTTVC